MDCLITELKEAAAQYAFLPKSGCIYMKARNVGTLQSADQCHLTISVISSAPDAVINIIGDGYMATTYAGLDIPAQRLTTYTVTHGVGTKDLYFKSGDYWVEVTNKYGVYTFRPNLSVNSAIPNVLSYNLEDIVFGRSGAVYACVSPSYGQIAAINNLPAPTLVNLTHSDVWGNIASLAGIAGLASLTIYNCDNVVGDIGSLANSAALTRLELTNTKFPSKFYGSIDGLGKLVNLTILQILDSEISGEIVNFVTAQIANGRTTCDTSSPIRCNSITAKCKFNGAIRSNDPDNRYSFLTWASASKIVIYDFCSANDYSTASVIYALGATAGEIAAWEAAGKEVIVVD